MIVRADWVLPITQQPIEQGEVVVQNGVIVDVRRRSGTRGSADVLDFGEAIILPGLVNAHTHLELTVLRGAVEDTPFFEWIRRLVDLKAALTESEWRDSALWGALEAAASGTTTVADTTDSGAAVYALTQVGLRGRVYQEVFAVSPEQTVAKTLDELENKLQQLHRATQGTAVQVGVAPHTLYTVRLEVMAALREYTRRKGYPVCIHAAESSDEIALLQEGKGKFAQMYAQREMRWEVHGKHPVDILHEQNWLDANTLLVHAVQTEPRHTELFAATHTAVAHCPQSNAKLTNGIAPLGEWLERGVRVGLGTDSVVSNNTLDMFAEMRSMVLLQRAVRGVDCGVTTRRAVETATAGGAHALGMAEQIGTLEPGKQADLCVVALDNVHCFPAYDPYAALVFSARASDVLMTMVAGKIVYQRGEYPQLREPVQRLRERLRYTVRRIRERLAQDETG
ncbi:MAG: amidohydrolase family protein [Armatimonadota bacterium]|nr:amidohydrolase family protein [bacterium]MDW8321207.1 amidohydrolase family protein [Armatimonadota bacterium]